MILLVLEKYKHTITDAIGLSNFKRRSLDLNRMFPREQCE